MSEFEKCIYDHRQTLTQILKKYKKGQITPLQSQSICEVISDCGDALHAHSDKEDPELSDELKKEKYIYNKMKPIMTQLVLHYSIEYENNHITNSNS